MKTSFVKNRLRLLLTTAVALTSVCASAQHPHSKSDSAIAMDSVRANMYEGSLFSMDAMTARYKSKQPDGKGGITIDEQKAGEAQKLFNLSRQYYRKAIAFAPGYYKAWGNLGSTYYLEGQTKEAIHYFRQAVKLNENYAAGWYDLGLAYDALKMQDSAIFSFTKSTQSDSGYIAGYQELSRIYMQQQNDSAKALGILRVAAKKNPASEVPWNCISAICLPLNDTAKAVNAMEKAAQVNPNNFERLDFLAQYFQKHGDAVKASYYSGMAAAARVRLYIPPDADPNAGH